MASKKPDDPKKPEPNNLAAKTIAKAAIASRKAAKRPAKGKGAAKASIAPGKPVAEVSEDATTEEAGELRGLSVREARFIDLYLLTHRVEQSYIEAGFNAKAGPSAQACVSRLLSSAKSRAYRVKRSEAMSKGAERTERMREERKAAQAARGD